MNLDYYLNLPQIKQHTDAWEKARENSITATDVATILECNEHQTRADLLLKKRGMHNSRDNTDTNTENTDWGTTFESVARSLTESRYDCKISQVGLKYHDKFNWLGASPDGITQSDLMSTSERVILTEFKCPILRPITGKIPFQYWIQMQIQMEVWNINQCLYSEHKFTKLTQEEYLEMIEHPENYSDIVYGNVPGEDEIFWRLDGDWDTIVQRDSEWFNRAFPMIDVFYTAMTQSNFYGLGGIDWNACMHTQDITNFLLDDPLLDFLNKYSQELSYEKDKVPAYDFQRYVMEKSGQFREHVISQLRENFKGEFIDIAEDNMIYPDVKDQLQIKYNHKSDRNYQRTFQAMNDGCAVIANGLVHNPKDLTYGKVDLIVREDCVDYMFKNRAPPTKIKSQPVPNENTALEGKIHKNMKRRGEHLPNSKKSRVESRVENASVGSSSNNSATKNKKRKAPTDSVEVAESVVGVKVGEPETATARLKRARHESYSKHGYKYVMVQIKYATLNLAANGVNLLNNPKQKLYKGHSALLNVALGEMLGYLPNESFIIGRKSSYTSKGLTYKQDSYVNSLGRIDYLERDKDYVASYREALTWLESLRNEGNKWLSNTKSGESPTKNNLKVKELYPNMKNDRDYPWHDLKVKFAKKIGELTQLLNLGVDKRNALHEMGIIDIDDVNLEALNTVKVREAEIVNTMIKSNRLNKPLNLKDISHPAIDTPPLVEFYIDFETVSDLHDDFTLLPKTNGSAIVSMIGCYVKNNLTGESQYMNYLVDHLTTKCEKNMIHNWIKDMQEIIKKTLTSYNSSKKTSETKKMNRNVPKIYVYHWSHAEAYHMDNALEHCADLLTNYDLEMIDLCKLFKEAHVGLPGCYSYGLKGVAKSLHKLGLIQTTWSDGLDGNQAMVATWKAEEIALKEGKTIPEVDFMESIIKYNYVDCKVLEEIVSHRRAISTD